MLPLLLKVEYFCPRKICNWFFSVLQIRKVVTNRNSPTTEVCWAKLMLHKGLWSSAEAVCWLFVAPVNSVSDWVCLASVLATAVGYTIYNLKRLYLQIWHKCSLGLKDELIIIWWLQVKVTNCDLKTNFDHNSSIHVLIVIKYTKYFFFFFFPF